MPYVPGPFSRHLTPRPLRNVFALCLTSFATLILSLASPAAQFKVGLVLDRGGKDDKSFNSSAFAGATAAKEKLGIFLKYVEAADDNAFEPSLRAFAQRDFDLIIGRHLLGG